MKEGFLGGEEFDVAVVGCVGVVDALAVGVVWGEAAEVDFFVGAFKDVLFVVVGPEVAEVFGVGVVEDFGGAVKGV